MHVRLIAALALTIPASLPAQTSNAAAAYAHATPLGGAWTYAAAAGGSQAVFADAAARTQLTVRCNRTTRRVSISKPASAAAPFLFVWTSSQSRNVPASFQPASAQVVADLPAMDALLDAIAFSRGRLAFSASGAPAIVLPVGPELTRVVEDCRT
jgi:hypothetical protein